MSLLLTMFSLLQITHVHRGRGISLVHRLRVYSALYHWGPLCESSSLMNRTINKLESELSAPLDLAMFTPGWIADIKTLHRPFFYFILFFFLQLWLSGSQETPGSDPQRLFLCLWGFPISVPIIYQHFSTCIFPKSLLTQVVLSYLVMWAFKAISTFR